MQNLINFFQEEENLIIEILLEKLDLFETPNVLADVESALKNYPSPAVFIDLKKVNTIDSSGIGFLIAIRNSLAKQKVPLIVICASETVLQIFRLTKVNQLIQIFKTRQEALAAAPKK